MAALNRGFYVTSAVALAGFAGAVYMMLNGPGVAWGWLLSCGVVGMVTAFLFVWITQYYTESRYRPVQSIAEASLTGPATNIISGLAVGMETPAVPVVVISAALLLSYYFGFRGLADVPNISAYAKGIYGTAIATMGMLSCAAYILAMDTFGPITDNAGGIIEMSNQPDSVRDKTDKLDSAGNTTKALTKGYAIGSASLAAFLLFSAYLEEIKTIVTARVADAQAAGIPASMPAGWSFTNINLAEIPVFVGALLGAMLTYLFSSLAIKAVGQNSADGRQRRSRPVPREPRHHARHIQARLRPLRLHRDRRRAEGDGAARRARGRPAGRGRLDLPPPQPRLRHVRDGRDGTAGLQLVPSINGVPVNLSGASAVAGLLMVGTISGVLLAMLMNNGGGAWDNAKKWIETGQYGGKKSDAHKAAVVGDTVGDPFKDTAGPSLHVLIKLLATITLVLAPLFL